MARPTSGRAILGIGPEAPPPSGEPDPELKKAILAQVDALTFRLRVNLWSLLWRWRVFPWREFIDRLKVSEFRSYANRGEARKSLGWAGLTKDKDRWLFGVLGYRIPLFGNSAMRHELFHATQDLMAGLFGRQPWLPRNVLAEISAHLWGGPLMATAVFTVILALGVAAYYLCVFILTFIF